MIWRSSANWSKNSWRVFVDGGRVLADETIDPEKQTLSQPEFVPTAGRFGEFPTRVLSAKVSDGWIVSFNAGEWGAGLYWFSLDGKQKREISDHAVVAFVPTADRILAIEGLTHLGPGSGSLIQLRHGGKGKGWRAQTVIRFPSAAPEAAVARKDGSILVVLSDSLVSVGRSGRVDRLMAADWRMMFPTSAALTGDEGKLYVGMRQYVAEITLATRAMRWLVPNESYLNKLPKDEEERIRAGARE